MNNEQLFNLIACFLIYLPIQSLLINGIYISAAGRTDQLPDGSSADSEMILYPLYKFLNQSVQKRVSFTLSVIKQRIPFFPNITGGTINWSGDGPLFALTPIPGQTLNLDELNKWADAYLSGKVEYDDFTRTVMIYQDVTFYKFSKYLRKPIITCIICMASFWSIFTFLIPVILYFGFSLKIIPIWVGNVFCLSYLNYVIFKPRK